LAFRCVIRAIRSMTRARRLECQWTFRTLRLRSARDATGSPVAS
jgi:hypothetical protein